MFLPSRTRRPGFTLVELMVSAAVCVIIMAVLSTVFQSGIDVMRDMRSVGSLQDQLRAATEMIRRDLQADHFVARDTKANGSLVNGPRLSDQWLTNAAWQPPVGGFFRIESDSSWNTEQSDSDGLNFTKNSNTPNFLLHFTSILPGDKPQNLYSANAASTISSPAAEICYFVDTSISTNHRLVRRQRLIARTDQECSKFLGLDTAGEVIAGNGSTVYTLANIAQHRITPSRTMLGGARAGDDILLSNIKLFEVKLNWDISPTPLGSIQAARTAGLGNTDSPFDYLSYSSSGNVFDTGDGTSISSGSILPTSTYSGSQPEFHKRRIRVKGLQIRIRIYDPQMKTTRQVTIVQDM